MMEKRVPVVLLLFLAGSVYSYNQPTCLQGTVIVHLFSWKWSDIAEECERFLGPKGFCGVQVSPVTEHAEITREENRPWWERYQTVSYKLHSRSGDRDEFVDMVQRCNNANVAIYVDTVFNHMTGWDRTGTGSGGSEYDGPSMNFPDFGPDDFNCCYCEMCDTGNCEINNYGNRNEVRNCRLVGLLDLALAKGSVQSTIAAHLNDLISIGVAGFRVDACKHMWPNDMEVIYSNLEDLNTQWWASGTQPFFFNEVIDKGGEPITADEYTHLGRVTEFRFCDNIGRVFRGEGASLKDLKSFGEEWGMLPDGDAFVFVDNHDNQRGHGGGGGIITHKEERLYTMATAYKLSWPYGFTRIMSSYYFDDGEVGPPSSGNGDILDVIIEPDGSCGNGWVCEHRWEPITNMALFRSYAADLPVENWWDNDANQIAFSRGDKAFIAFNNDWDDLSMTLATGMPEGTYCDVISGIPTDDGCTGEEVYVDSSGNAQITIPSGAPNPMVAIHEGSLSGSGGPTPTPGPSTTPGSTTPTTPTTPPPDGYQRTAVFLRLETQPGQDVFLRGGIDHDNRPGCTDDAATSACAISILHRDIGTGEHYEGYNAWKVGDTKLDWYGAEPGQGSYNGQPASGSPSVWTTTDQSHPGYQPTNIYGEHYWLFEVDMNCEETEGGWFELKGFATNMGDGWEGDISQISSCTGSVGGSNPLTSTNHVGRCGYINVFEWNSPGCIIDEF